MQSPRICSERVLSARLRVQPPCHRLPRTTSPALPSNTARLSIEASVSPRTALSRQPPPPSCTMAVAAATTNASGGKPAAIIIPAGPTERNLLSAASAWIPPPTAADFLANPDHGGGSGRAGQGPRAAGRCITAGDLAQWRGQHPSDPLRPPAGTEANDKATLKNYRCDFPLRLTPASPCDEGVGSFSPRCPLSPTRSLRGSGKGCTASTSSIEALSVPFCSPAMPREAGQMGGSRYPTPASPERAGQVADCVGTRPPKCSGRRQNDGKPPHSGSMHQSK